jgi:hypothetical protein
MSEFITLATFDTLTLDLTPMGFTLLGISGSPLLFISTPDAFSLLDAINEFELTRKSEEDKLSILVHLSFPIPYSDELVPEEEEDQLAYLSRQTVGGYVRIAEWKTKVALDRVHEEAQRIHTSQDTFMLTRQNCYMAQSPMSPGYDNKPYPHNPYGFPPMYTGYHGNSQRDRWDDAQTESSYGRTHPL